MIAAVILYSFVSLDLTVHISCVLLANIEFQILREGISFFQVGNELNYRFSNIAIFLRLACFSSLRALELGPRIAMQLIPGWDHHLKD